MTREQLERRQAEMQAKSAESAEDRKRKRRQRRHRMRAAQQARRAEVRQGAAIACALRELEELEAERRYTAAHGCATSWPALLDRSKYAYAPAIQSGGGGD